MDDQLLARLDERSIAVAELLKTQNAHVDEKLDEIISDGKETLKLAKATNGRVTKLEIWQAVVTGQGKVLYWIGGVFCVGVGYLINHFLG